MIFGNFPAPGTAHPPVCPGLVIELCCVNDRLPLLHKGADEKVGKFFQLLLIDQLRQTIVPAELIEGVQCLLDSDVIVPPKTALFGGKWIEKGKTS